MKSITLPDDTLVFECDFDEPPERVWRALTDSRLRAIWLQETTAELQQATGPQQATEPQQAAAEPRQPTAELQEATADTWRLVEAEPHRLLRYRWRDRGDRDRRDAGSPASGDGAARPRSGVGAIGPARGDGAVGLVGAVESLVTFELWSTERGGTHLRLSQGDFRLIASLPRASLPRARRSSAVRRYSTRRMLGMRAYAYRRAA